MSALQKLNGLLEHDAIDYDINEQPARSLPTSLIEGASQQELVKQLESIFLSPLTSFSDEWLNLLQV